MCEFLETKLFWIAVILFATYMYLKCYVYSYWKRRGIPYDSPSIPLGNVPLSYFFGKFSLGQVFRASYRKYSQYPFHGLYIFNQPVVMINDPELIRTILVKEFSKFSDRGWFANEKVDPMSANLFLQPYDKWKVLRSKFTPTFTPSKLRLMYPFVSEVSDELIKACDAELKNSNVIDVKDVLARYTTDIISNTVYGFNCNSLKDPNSVSRQFGIRAFEFGRINLLIGIFFPEIPKLMSVPFYNKEVRQFFGDIFNGSLEKRRKQNIVRKDFMNLLMQLIDNGILDDDETMAKSSRELRMCLIKSFITETKDKLSLADAAAQAFVFFLGGFETASSTVTYCLLQLAMNPDIQTKLQEEIDKIAESSEGFTYDTINDLEYLDMVFTETMRKRSIVDYINRICVEDFAVPNSNYVVKKGTRIILSVTAIHHNSKIYPDPTRFDPLRFTKENAASR